MYKVVFFNANNSSVVFLTIDLSLEMILSHHLGK